MVCQVTYGRVLSLLSDVGVAGFQEALRSKYPNFRPEQSADFAWQPTQIGVNLSAPTWKLTDESGQWTVSIGADFVSLDTTNYSHFPDFAQRFAEILAAVERTVRPGSSRRVGLRKINRFQHPDVTRPSDWEGLLRPELLGLSLAELPWPVDRAGSESVVHSEDATIVLRYGFSEPAAFIFDMDCFTERHFNIEPASGLLDVLSTFSSNLTGLFRWALLPKLDNYLEPAPRAKEA